MMPFGMSPWMDRNVWVSVLVGMQMVPVVA